MDCANSGCLRSMFYEYSDSVLLMQMRLVSCNVHTRCICVFEVAVCGGVKIRPRRADRGLGVNPRALGSAVPAPDNDIYVLRAFSVFRVCCLFRTLNVRFLGANHVLLRCRKNMQIWQFEIAISREACLLHTLYPYCPCCPTLPQTFSHGVCK